MHRLRVLQAEELQTEVAFDLVDLARALYQLAFLSSTEILAFIVKLTWESKRRRISTRRNHDRVRNSLPFSGVGRRDRINNRLSLFLSNFYPHHVSR